MRRALLAAIAAFLLLPDDAAGAEHVSVTLHVSARLGERVGDTSWAVVVDWSVECRRDRLIGGAGSDRLTGGRGADTLVGGPGVNRYDGGAGNDVVNARNGRAELVSCGSGRDLARVDRRGKVRRCERVKRARR